MRIIVFRFHREIEIPKYKFVIILNDVVAENNGVTMDGVLDVRWISHTRSVEIILLTLAGGHLTY